MDIREILEAMIPRLSRDPGAYRDCCAMLAELAKDDPDAELALNARAREQARAAVVGCGEDVDSAREVLQSLDTMLMLDARRDFDAYMQAMEFHRDPSRRFWAPRRRVLMPICRDLQDLADGRLDLLSISLPPRVGKSTTAIFFLTWVMGRNPESANVVSGHSDKLTRGFWQEALSIITDDAQYRFAEIFPDAPLVAKDSMNETIHLRSRRRFPTLTCRSIDGTLTGAVEVGRDSLLYCDDMVSDREEALNADRMEKLYDAYLNQLKDRKLEGAKELHIGTRWVPNDVIGRIEEQYRGNPRYRFSTLPALDERGESNFVYERGLGFSTAYYEDMRRSLVDAGEEDSWSAKYMCAPYWKEGRLFEPDDLSWFEGTPEGDPDITLSVCDSKTTGKDFCVQVVVQVYGGDHYVVDAVCDDGMMDAIQPMLVEQICKWDVDRAFFESNMAGGVIAREVRDACRLRGCAVDVKTSYTTTGRAVGRGNYKDTRILADAGWIKQRCLFLDPGRQGPQYRQFMRQLTAYSAKGKNAHDDAPDAMSMYRRFAQGSVAARVEAVRRPF